MSCLHYRIDTYKFADTGEPSGLWCCAECKRKFVPLDLGALALLADAKEAERYRWLRHGDNDELVLVDNDHRPFHQSPDAGWFLLRNAQLDEAIDAAIAAAADRANRSKP